MNNFFTNTVGAVKWDHFGPSYFWW